MAKIPAPLIKRALRKMICFYQPDTGRAADSGDNGSVVPGRQIDQERRFCRISRSKPGRNNGVILPVLPIIVTAHSYSLCIKKIETRISEHTLHSMGGERRA